MAFYLSERSLRHMEGIDDRLIEITKSAIKITKIDFGVPETGGIRDEVTQHKLFLEGLSKLDGRYKKSNHQSGKALDLYGLHPKTGDGMWGVKYLAQVACAMLQSANELGYKLQWGGFWSTFRDMPHFELVD